jgi:phenylacetate-coenzyme A ligase PaaK-like adenylate-forming protein
VVNQRATPTPEIDTFAGSSNESAFFMKLDFSDYPISGRGYATRPMAFLDIVPGKMLQAIIELSLIETGSPAARERWQKAQLRNLLTHAAQRSAFWRNRVGAKRADLSGLPVLTRTELKQQVETEGSLLRPADGLEIATHKTSGSSGTPVEFHTSKMNIEYNHLRYLAQEFMDGKDLSVNRTHMNAAKASAAKKLAAIPCGFSVEKNPSWLGGIGSVFTSGILKKIECLNPNPRDLVRELRKDAVGQLVVGPGLLTTILGHSSAKLLGELRASEVVVFGEAIDTDVCQAIVAQGIAVSLTYSSEEVGPIGFECQSAPGHYHIATSNVIVELEGSHEVDGKKLGRVLVTHLHSYATPFVRYDLGDLALLSENCPCGHDGPTIHSLYGRLTNALKRRDGTLSAFYIRGPELREIVEYTEFRIRQPAFDTIVIELGGRETLTAEEVKKITAFLKARAGDEFKIDVVACSAIDWGSSAKKLSFRCEV